MDMGPRHSRWVVRVMVVGSLLAAVAGCERDFSEPPPAPLPEVTLLIGRIVDDGLSPVAGARVRLVECGLGTETGQDGQFSIDEVPNGDYTIRVDAEVEVAGGLEGLALQLAELVELRGAVRDLDDVVLPASGSVSGMISTSDGSSPLNAVVYVPGGDRIAPVADDGSFVLDRVPAGQWAIGVAKPGYQVSQPPEQRSVQVAAGGQVQGVAMTLEPIPAGAVASVSGTVLLSNPGPEQGVEVALEERFSAVRYRTVTSETGLFALGGIPAGFYLLVASHQGYRTVGLANLELRDGDALELDQAIILPKADRVDTEYPWVDDPTGNPDDDYDGVLDTDDNCPVVPNPDQSDADGDGVGNLCDLDFVELPDPDDPDGDGVSQGEDNCPGAVNPGQENSDDDPLGDACDPDDDNDGILDETDLCRVIPDPTNTAELCNWGPDYLVYSAQTPAGDITLRRLSASQDGFSEQAWNTGSGEAWGAAVSDDDLVFYHHRADQTSPFRLCMVPLQNTDAVPRCWRNGEWSAGGDMMNPSVCRDGRTGMQWLYYERQEPGLGWRIWATQVPADVVSLGPGIELDLLSQHMPPIVEREIVNVRDPACQYSVQMGLDMAYTVDFRETAGAPDATLDWNAWTANLDGDTVNWRGPLSDYSMGFMGIVHERRPNPGPLGLWFLDVLSGQRSDIAQAYGEGGAESIISNGASNQAPAYLEIRDDPPVGLLAYQSDLGGTADIYLYAPMSAISVQVTWVDGWAGSPAWSR